MKSQIHDRLQLQSRPVQNTGSLLHAAVSIAPDDELHSHIPTETRFSHSFSQVAVGNGLQDVGQPKSISFCPLFPQRCPFGGGCHTCPPSALAKLKIRQPEDKYRQEADQVAEQVAKISSIAFAENSMIDGVTSSAHIQKSCTECEEKLQPKKEDEFLQSKLIFGQPPREENITKSHRYRVRPNFVSCRANGIWNPRVTGPDAVNEITNADTEAITLGRRAENMIFLQRLTFGTALYAADAVFDNALTNRFGLNLNNVNDRENTLPIIERRFNRASDILEGGSMRYTCRGVDCGPGDHAYSDPGFYRIHLCNGFWNTPNDRANTILHEALHIYFESIGDTEGCPTPDISNAWCYELFAEDIS